MMRAEPKSPHPGHKLFDHTRSDRSGGGTALLIRENLHASRVDAGERTSFEFPHSMVEFQSRRLEAQSISVQS